MQHIIFTYLELDLFWCVSYVQVDRDNSINNEQAPRFLF